MGHEFWGSTIINEFSNECGTQMSHIFHLYTSPLCMLKPFTTFKLTFIVHWKQQDSNAGNEFKFAALGLAMGRDERVSQQCQLWIGTILTDAAQF